jgi:hypothetical protein
VIKKVKNWKRSKPWVDVMITIFCDFRQFSAKIWRFSQIFCIIQLCFDSKSPFFSPIFFGENIFKNHIIGPMSVLADFGRQTYNKIAL